MCIELHKSYILGQKCHNTSTKSYSNGEFTYEKMCYTLHVPGHTAK